MKKIVLSVAAVFAFGFAAQAQEKSVYGFKQSDVFLEGSFGIKSTTFKPEVGDKVNVTSFNVNPKIGYMLSDKVAVGVSAAFGKNSTLDEVFEDRYGLNSDFFAGDHVKNTYAGVFGRYNFLQLGNRFTTYTEVGIGFNQFKGNTMENSMTPSYSAEISGVKAGLTLGFNYFVTPSIALSFNLGDVFAYESYNLKVDGSKEATISNTESNLNVFNNFFDNAKFGMTYKF
ncbi:hypothetical protein [Flavobacterium sp. JP2137]|uniref:hypothetical protein n=1 Tax=Flavobacterium sp. JP2137 TaxID=3414510 RepID=UPI003D2FBA23